MTETATILAFSNGVNDLILGIMAAVLVGFALVVSLVIPRRYPNFPGRRIGLFVTVAVLLVIGMLVAVEALGESHHFNTAEGTEQTTSAPAETGQTTTGGETQTGETQTETSGGQATGDATAGKQVFESAGCTSCHTLQEAGATGTVGPNLDDVLKGKTPDFIHESIVDPNKEIAQGFAPNVMPQNYEQQLSETQLADLVAFLSQATS
ncbi:MAG TPA: c-type cytochrome [Gaiellaceae bacterium]